MRRAKIKDISVSLLNDIGLSLVGFPNIVYVNINNIRMGGLNCEITRLVRGGVIEFDSDDIVCDGVRLKKCTVVADTISEVDEDGELIKW